MTVADLVEFVECGEYLLAHLDHFQFELWRLGGLSTLHVEEPALVEVDPAVAHHQLGALLLRAEGKSHDLW